MNTDADGRNQKKSHKIDLIFGTGLQHANFLESIIKTRTYTIYCWVVVATFDYEKFTVRLMQLKTFKILYFSVCYNICAHMKGDSIFHHVNAGLFLLRFNYDQRWNFAILFSSFWFGNSGNVSNLTTFNFHEKVNLLWWGAKIWWFVVLYEKW